MRTYITCVKRKANPKVPIEVCLHRCRHRKKCAVFNRVQNPSLFPEFTDHAVTGTR
ncbi:MAG TPA: hypothetical protein PLB81_04455 [Deltaproteobacteria bacterium]|mgnify:CR=1 FL=1|nr:hypothetical protein [Deltaproteobacteria bacterium]